MYTIDLPNISETPYIVVPTVIGDTKYYFEYRWNIRAELVFLSVYTINGGITKYVCKNQSLVYGHDVSAYTDYEGWNATLTFCSKNMNTEEYTQTSFSTDFELDYVELDSDE